MKYKGQGQIVNIKQGRGKINSLRVQTGSVLRLTQTELIVHKITEPIIFGGHFGTQSPGINGNYVT